ncbi:MAG: hypothetical protein L0G80_20065 [Shewanella sp.]|uniref:hypothetical protein n=1 Tax=Shewanella sp. TaxID=50422 RepID=UPI00264844F2|nr:hypothetical protein [Shewanella sp.]MDN5502187.1 hypothetical protein [Shewanella sp.]MDN5530093.1 hypothetical protein [Shewanella sp.]
MKLKKISIMTFAALYATGIGTLVANPLDRNQAEQKLIGIKLAPEQILANKNKPTHPALNRANRPGQIGMNVHRAVNGSSHKAPFAWEKDIDGTHTYITDIPQLI